MTQAKPWVYQDDDFQVSVRVSSACLFAWMLLLMHKRPTFDDLVCVPLKALPKASIHPKPCSAAALVHDSATCTSMHSYHTATNQSHNHLLVQAFPARPLCLGMSVRPRPYLFRVHVKPHLIGHCAGDVHAAFFHVQQPL